MSQQISFSNNKNNNKNLNVEKNNIIEKNNKNYKYDNKNNF
jgi:hypothetical protein